MTLISFLRNLASPMQKISFEEAHQKIAAKALKWTADPRSDIHWAAYSDLNIEPEPFINDLLGQFANEGVTEGSAVDIGSGSGVHTLNLLAFNWDVTAVDCNKVALSRLQENTKEMRRLCLTASPLLRFGTLNPVLSHMENFIFPYKEVDLVLAMHSFAYCNPAKFLTVWNRAHEALRPGGRIVANFATKPLIPLPLKINSHSWHTEPPVVEALLREKKYEVEIFSVPKKMWIHSGSLMVIGRKV